MRPVGTTVALVVPLAWAGAEVQAQEEALPPPGAAGDGEPVVLTLDDALRLATDFNPQYRRATNELEITPTERRDAWLGLLPEPRVSAFSTSMRWNRQHLETDFFGDPVEREDEGTVRTSAARQDLSLTFDLDPEDYVRLREAERQGEIRELEAEESRAELRADVVAAFLDAQEAAMAVELEEELLDVEEEHLETVERQFQLAREDWSEVLGAELDVEEQRDRVHEARADRDRALLRLRNLVGAPELDEIEIEPVDLPLFDPERIDPDDLVVAARHGSPQLERETRELRQARESQRWNRWSPWIPSLDASVRLARNDIVRGGAAFFDPPTALGWDRDFQVAISLPDPAGYLRARNEQRRDEVEVRNREETLREERARLEEDARGGLMDLERDHLRVTRQESRVELAEERLAEALESYRLGRISYLELQSASEAAAEARRNALEARYEFQATRLELERSLGLRLDDLFGDVVPAIGG